MVKYYNGRRYSSIVGVYERKLQLDKPVEKECARYYCKRIEQPGCCRACPVFLSCDVACLNEPAKCGLAIE